MSKDDLHEGDPDWNPDKDKLPDEYLKKAMGFMDEVMKQKPSGGLPIGAHALVVNNRITIIPIKNGFLVQYTEIAWREDIKARVPGSVTVACRDINEILDTVKVAIQHMDALQRTLDGTVLGG